MNEKKNDAFILKPADADLHFLFLMRDLLFLGKRRSTELFKSVSIF